MKPDAIPIRVLGSRAVLSARDLEAAFGKNATLRPSATVEVVCRGKVAARVPVESGDRTRLVLDATADLEGEPAVLRGPVGAVSGLMPERARSRLVLPGGLRRAWGLGETATLSLGSVAAAVTVEDGPTGAEIERALWLAAGRPETTRWLPAVALEAAPDTDLEDDGRIERRVVTENDVRQARRKRQTIRLRPGQIVTPAARSLGAEWGVLEDEA